MRQRRLRGRVEALYNSVLAGPGVRDAAARRVPLRSLACGVAHRDVSFSLVEVRVVQDLAWHAVTGLLLRSVALDGLPAGFDELVLHISCAATEWVLAAVASSDESLVHEVTTRFAFLS